MKIITSAILNDIATNSVKCTTGDILCSYFEVNSDKELLNILEKDKHGIVSYWSIKNGMNKDTLIDWIDASLDTKAKFSITNNIGSNYAPECLLDLDGGVLLTFNWNL